MNDLTILNEIHKGITMGMDSLENISKKTSDNEFRDDLSFQYDTYLKTLNKVENEFKKIGRIPDDTPLNQKIMGWSGIQLNTINDTSNTNLSEILIQGYDMGVIKGIELLNKNPEASDNVKKILNEFIHIQENNIDRLKKFL